MASQQTTPQRYEDVILRRNFERWEACRQPEAWAQYRDAAAKALPWFTAVQGGICKTVSGDKKHPRYSDTVYVTGLLMDGFPSINSYVDAEVIITSIHGAQEPGKEFGAEAKRRDDALRNTQADKRLVGCIIGSKSTVAIPLTRKTTSKEWFKPGCAFFSCPMPQNQGLWVLGFYIITDYWLAHTPQGLVNMARLERWKLEDKAWFAKKDAGHDPPPLTARDFVTKAPEETCPACDQNGPRMFEEHFLCRNEKCADFWKHKGEIVKGELTYTKPYLQQRQSRSDDGFKPYGAYPGSNNFPEIAPAFRDAWLTSYDGLRNQPMTKKTFLDRMTFLSSGFWCPACGMLNRRLKWHNWNCANAGCSFELEGGPRPITANELAALGDPKPVNWPKINEHCFSHEEDTPNFMQYHYNLGHGCGITVLEPKPGVNAMPTASDDLWHKVLNFANSATLALTKEFVPTASKGTVTSHFISNVGEPYSLQVQMSGDVPFNGAPVEIRNALNLINGLCRRYSTRPGQEDFNECYIAGYFAKDTMHWHNDGEVGLGSVIATWTLGGEGDMKVAPNNLQYFGKHKDNRTFIYEEDLVLPGVVKEDERRKLKERLDRVRAANPDNLQPDQRTAYEAALKEYKDAFADLMKDVVRTPKAKPRAFMTIPLSHGSIVIMHGDDFQKNFLHQVSVGASIRIALTFRHISKKHHEQAQKVAKIHEYPHVPDNTKYLEEFEEEQAEYARRNFVQGGTLDATGSASADTGAGAGASAIAAACVDTGARAGASVDVGSAPASVLTSAPTSAGNDDDRTSAPVTGIAKAKAKPATRSSKSGDPKDQIKPKRKKEDDDDDYKPAPRRLIKRVRTR